MRPKAKTCKHPDGCPKKAIGKGWCHTHYMRIRRHGEPGPVELQPPGKKRARAECTIGGCDKPYLAKGLCRKHYAREYRSGSTEDPTPTPELCQHEGGCKREYYASGFCRMHYWRFNVTGNPGPVDSRARSPIEISDAGTIVCRVCHTDKAIDEYPSRSDGRVLGVCKPCMRKQNQLRKYGVCVTDESKCAICGSNTSLHVDHDHETGKTRDILCAACNKALGLMCDDQNRLRAAADYLDKHKKPPIKTKGAHPQCPPQQ